ncbi:hypothetical protein ACFOLA_04260 [Salinicoccus hispanicus]|uniref:Uncharacterized protein n=1 Tax=Salinicoccus hispanicus TaxID=157225 RepID=A0A6N8U3W7_9STAP|nr:hypothetical protein [Salinicoccus hispanicus]MXQ52027.1 hypothetical protein [Salinicoccus hispanicus]
MELVIILIVIGLGFFAYRRLRGYRQGQIILEMDDRYSDQTKYVEAVQRELTNEGRQVEYKGKNKFLIDGQIYILMEHNVSMGPGVVQRTILTPEK